MDDLDRLLAADDDEDEWPRYVLPPDWFEYNDVLRYTRDWAIGRLVPPDLLLAEVLAETLLRAPTAVRLPGIIGGPSALNFGVVKVAETGVGKTTGGRSLLREATAGPLTAKRVWPLATGEGVAEAMLGTDTDDDGNRLPDGNPVLISCDEGSVLELLVAREGATIVPALCSAISGGELGQGNATAKLRRIIPPMTYRCAVVIAIQPSYLLGPWANFDGGLPQRFLFVSGTGHALTTAAPAPDPPHIKFPEVEFDPSRPFVDVPFEIRTEIRVAHFNRLKAIDGGDDVADTSHRSLLRLRIATALARMEGRAAPAVRDWQHAVAVVNTSDATVARGEAMREEAARERARSERERLARIAVASDAAVEVDRVRRLAVELDRRVRAEPGQTRRDHRSRLSAGRRLLLDDAIDHAIQKGWIEERPAPSRTDQERRELHPGEVRP